MAKQDISVEHLVGMIARGELRLPEMQRDYVWRGPRVRDLLDSLYRGYPSGAILVWETEEPVPLREMAIAQEENPYQKTLLLLDGQQRLTSLSAVLRGEPLSVPGRKWPIELLFNLEHPEAVLAADIDEGADEDVGDEAVDADELSRRINELTFVIGTKKLAAMPQWVGVSEVFTSEDNGLFLQRAGLTGFDDPRYAKYSQRLARLRGIRKYEYRMDVLERSLTYEDVTDIFVRVNSLGAKLRSSDLALAQITARWRHSLVVFQAFQAECAGRNFDLDLGIHLKAMIAFTTGQSRFLTVGKLKLDELQNGWAEATEGMRFAINFLKSNVGIDGDGLLSSPFLMIVLAFYGHARGYSLGAAEAAQLRRWVLLANTKGRFSRGSTETILDQDLAAIGRGERAEALIERLRLQFGRLDVTVAELEGKDSRSSLFKTMFLAFRSGGAKDWTSNLAISMTHAGSQHRLEAHHFFPKALLAKAGLASREAEDIANLAFIGGKTNRRISDKSPADYVPELLGDSAGPLLAQQAIPTEPQLWVPERYREFLRLRREEIARVINTFLAEVTPGERPIEALIAEEEHERLEFKGSLRWDLVERRVNPVLEQVVIKSVAALSNSAGGTLLIGVHDGGAVLGLEPDYISLDGNRDAFERHLRKLIQNRWGVATGIGTVTVSFPVSQAGTELCRVDVHAGSRPLFVEVADKNGVKNERLFVRSGNASIPVESASQVAEYVNGRFPSYAAA